MDEFTFNILVIFFPGILATFIVDKFTFHRERKAFTFFTHSFLLGLSSILFYFPFKRGININDFHELLFSTDLIWISMIAIILSVSLIAVDRNKLLYKFANKIKLSNQTGELDTWAYYLNSDEIEWVTIRDKNKNLMYQGKIEAFSNGEKDPREIILKNAIVFQESDGEKLYEINALYLSFSINESIIIDYNQGDLKNG